MIAVSAVALHAIEAILYLITPWQYQPRLGILFYILSRLVSIHRGLACYSISYHALAVSTEAWHSILYLITPWQYPPRLGMFFYILSRFGSIRPGLAFYSISYHALAVSASLYLITLWQYPPGYIKPWQYPPTLGILFYCWSRLGSIRRGDILSRLGITPWQYQPRVGMLYLNLSYESSSLTNSDSDIQHVGVRGTCWHAEEVVDFASGRGYSIG